MFTIEIFVSKADLKKLKTVQFNPLADLSSKATRIRHMLVNHLFKSTYTAINTWYIEDHQVSWRLTGEYKAVDSWIELNNETRFWDLKLFALPFVKKILYEQLECEIPIKVIVRKLSNAPTDEHQL